MKKFLWCGGSHLANSKNSIERIFKDSDNTFFPTAGPVNRDWFKSGGMYNIEGDVVADPRDQRLVFDVSQYSMVIFIGQYINIRFFCANSRLVSRALYKTIYPYKIAPFIKGVNHPLQLFLQHFGYKCMLVPEPSPISNLSEQNQIPLLTHDYYWDMLRNFCSCYDSILIEENLSLVGKDRLTLIKYVGRDSRHANECYWDIRIQDIKNILDNLSISKSHIASSR